MNIKTWIKYDKPYYPPRCRKARYTGCEEYVDIRLREAHKRDMVLAYEDKSYEGKGKIYRYNGKLWAKSKLSPSNRVDGVVETAFDWLVYSNASCSNYFSNYLDGRDNGRESMIKKAKQDMARLLLVDGVLYERVVKPVYIIVTFGCGNGDGTGLFVEYPIRRCGGLQYSAENGKEAVAKAKEIATARGDLSCVRYFKQYIVCY